MKLLASESRPLAKLPSSKLRLAKSHLWAKLAQRIELLPSAELLAELWPPSEPCLAQLRAELAKLSSDPSAEP